MYNIDKVLGHIFLSILLILYFSGTLKKPTTGKQNQIIGGTK